MRVDNRHDVILAHDNQFLIVDLDFGPAVFAKQDSVALDDDPVVQWTNSHRNLLSL